MKNLNLFLAVITFTYSSISLAEVREVRSMRDILGFINPRGFVVFDIDNTITEPVQTIGSDQFFSYLVEKGKASGLAEKDAVEQALQQASWIQPITRVKAVESITPALIAHLQRNGVPVVALTARPLKWSEGTLRQLGSIYVNFPTAPRPRFPVLGGSTPVCTYIRGVLFMSPHGNKGDCLIAYMNETRIHPERVIFIDDKVKNVTDVEAALSKTPLTHTSLRYGAADTRVASFDKTLAEFEWAYYLRFRVILSDQEAYRLMGVRRVCYHSEACL
ncbi:MAG: DUF2608 domain-containing protein [Bdellovibrionia bacterium]